MLQKIPNRQSDLRDYLDFFKINNKMINDIMGVALARGGDFCDIYFQHKTSNFIGLEDEQVDRAYSNIDSGVGVRVLKGDRTGYSYSEEIVPQKITAAARTASYISSLNQHIEPGKMKPMSVPNFYPVETPWEKVSIDQKIPVLQEIKNKVFSLDFRIIKSNVWFANETSIILIATSDGRIAFDYQPMATLYVSCVAEDNGKREQNGFSLAGRYGFEIASPDNINRLATEAVKRTIILFDAVKPKAGEMPVVLAAGSSGILLHEAIGHGMEADFNRKKVSIFSERIGTPIADKNVTIIDSGKIPGIRGSINIDDEGIETQETVLVENGRLVSYLHDRISAQYYKVAPTGNGRRESFRYAPLPRMRNTFMINGPYKNEEIISSVKNGIYAETFSNGQVFIGAGDFTFYVKNGYLIENGKLTKPLKDINIIGNGPKVLENIVMVGDDFEMAEGGWTCGKDGQGVPVSQGLPTIKVSKITVGGFNL